MVLSDPAWMIVTQGPIGQIRLLDDFDAVIDEYLNKVSSFFV